MHAAARPAIASRFENMTGSLNSTGDHASRVPSTEPQERSNCLYIRSLPDDLDRPDCHLQMISVLRREQCPGVGGHVGTDTAAAPRWHLFGSALLLRSP